jgi:phosphatidylglycerol---prolipoprotein diacylglyceryl transferase
MHRVLISSPHIGAYSALLLLAFVVGWWLARRIARRCSIQPRHVDNLTLLVALTSLFGARFFSWLFYFPPGYSFVKAMTMGGGGMVFYGGLIFGIATVVIYVLVTKLNLRHVADVFAPSVALGLAIGRVGCFMAGCCWGDVCVNGNQLHLHDATLRAQVRTVPLLSPGGFPLAVTFPRDAGAYEQHQTLGFITTHAARSLPVHPVQLYEAALAALLVWGLYRSLQQQTRPGQTAARLILGYAAIRFVTEFFRADNSPAYFGFTLSQSISIALATTVLLFAVRRRSHLAVAAVR